MARRFCASTHTIKIDFSMTKLSLLALKKVKPPTRGYGDRKTGTFRMAGHMSRHSAGQLSLAHCSAPSCLTGRHHTAVGAAVPSLRSISAAPAGPPWVVRAAHKAIAGPSEQVNARHSQRLDLSTAWLRSSRCLAALLAGDRCAEQDASATLWAQRPNRCWSGGAE